MPLVALSYEGINSQANHFFTYILWTYARSEDDWRESSAPMHYLKTASSAIRLGSIGLRYTFERFVSALSNPVVALVHKAKVVVCTLALSFSVVRHFKISVNFASTLRTTHYMLNLTIYSTSSASVMTVRASSTRCQEENGTELHLRYYVRLILLASH